MDDSYESDEEMEEIRPEYEPEVLINEESVDDSDCVISIPDETDSESEWNFY